MYVFVEWLEFIYGGGQRGRGDVVEDVYSWSSVSDNPYQEDEYVILHITAQRTPSIHSKGHKP